MTDLDIKGGGDGGYEASTSSSRSTPIKEPAVDVGGSVPFLNKPDLLDTIMCRQKIGPRCKLCLKFRVTTPDQEMRWRFRALKGKLNFAIYRQKITDTEINTCQQISEKMEPTTAGETVFS